MLTTAMKYGKIQSGKLGFSKWFTKKLQYYFKTEDFCEVLHIFVGPKIKILESPSNFYAFFVWLFLKSWKASDATNHKWHVNTLVHERLDCSEVPISNNIMPLPCYSCAKLGRQYLNKTKYMNLYLTHNYQSFFSE